MSRNAEDALDVFAADGLPAGDGVGAAIGERGGHGGEVAAMAEDRALAEISFDDGHRVAGEDAEVPQHVADGAVAMAGGAFGAIDGFVDGKRAPRAVREHFHDAAQLHLLVPPLDEPGGGDGAGVDHRVARAARAGVEADGVECVAGGLDADLGEDFRAAMVREGEAIDEGLRDGLDGELVPRVAHLIDAAIGGDDADAEPLRIRFGQLGDVGGDLAVGDGGEFPEQFLQLIVDRR